MRLVNVIEEQAEAHKLLAALGMPRDPPTFARARDPSGHWNDQVGAAYVDDLEDA